MLFVFIKVLIFRSTDISLTSEIEIQLFVRSQHVHFPFFVLAKRVYNLVAREARVHHVNRALS